MPYVYCMPAKITEFVHALDNKVSGKIEVEGVEYAFSTRKHIVQAVNRHYSTCAWKPRLGSAVLIDGDLGKKSVLVDHIEADLMVDVAAEDPILDQIASTLRAIPNATNTMRHWKPQVVGSPIRFRWAGEVGKSAGIDAERSALVHAMLDPATGRWTSWCVDTSTGRLVGSGLPAAARRLVGRTFIGPEEKKRPVPVRRAPRSTVPLEDCPF